MPSSVGKWWAGKKKERAIAPSFLAQGKPDPHQGKRATLFGRRRKSKAQCLEREREEKGPAGCDPADVHRHAAQTSRYIENPMIPFPSQSEHKKQHAIDPRCTQSRPAGVPSASRTLQPTTLSSRWPQAVRTRKICKIRVKPCARRCARAARVRPARCARRACAPRGNRQHACDDYTAVFEL